ncbi:RluA family pseudouridine synthase [Prochlorococcus marinus]|uniref:RluA family pseudouridine synthase n=1 Tax=Prochlorococcus marinus TaxID=1219 RepID=UPI001ADCE1D5|nr:RluA family pseudouridine synthase [Prochlorococcus marinus]MBO8203763.1 RluA family pseudouridine synthase [Prochlorococcus marinus CUG1415]MBW3043067.1 pseudouridine synthase [Prochlorococcus marinus str. MU1415]
MELDNQNSFGIGEGELIEIIYELPLPMRLDRWLVSKRPEQSRARIQHFINSGLVLVNYKTAKAKTPLKIGDNVQIWMPPPEPLVYLKPEKMDLEILFEDEHIIVINKQSGLIVHPAPGHKSGTLVNGLLFHCNDLPGINGKLRPGIVHRLDKDTSGCMVVAKSQEALVNLQKQIKEKIASREYIAVIHGAPNSEEGQIVGHIGRDKFNRLKYKVVEEASGRYACTYWKLKERLGNYSLMNFKLDTGRTHQIRVHCAHINHPIVGDPLYGRCKKLPCKLKGQALHAFKLGLIHPINGKEMIFEAGLPLDFKKLLNVLKAK